MELLDDGDSPMSEWSWLVLTFEFSAQVDILKFSEYPPDH